MSTNEKTVITVKADVNAPAAKVWEMWVSPKHITQWNNASDEWHTPSAESDVREGGRFTARMEAKDGSMGFDFAGQYNLVQPTEKLRYTLDDGRKVEVLFSEEDNITTITESFEAETQNSVELQQQGWQAILDNFKKYAESNP